MAMRVAAWGGPGMVAALGREEQAMRAAALVPLAPSNHSDPLFSGYSRSHLYLH